MTDLQVSTGAESFRALRKGHYYYVDKTSFLVDFFQRQSAVATLITRPRRFGKTLTMSMLQEFLDIRNAPSQPEGEQEDVFAGLEVMNYPDICSKWMHRCPTIFLSLKSMGMKSFKKAIFQYSLILGGILVKNSFLEKSPKVEERDRRFLAGIGPSRDDDLLSGSLLAICRAMEAYYGKPVVLLIDEYDVPLQYAKQNGYYDEMIDFLRTLLGSALKTNPSLHFAVLTGCLRVAKESIFTGLNNFKCYGISDERFADKIGFTSAEVDKILADFGLSSKKAEVKEWYDGYRFGNCSEIYCPWDVIQYVDDHQTCPDKAPMMYWINSSENSIVLDFLKNSGWEAKGKLEELVRHGSVEAKLQEALTYDSLYASESSLWTLLYLTGYLTKADAADMGGGLGGHSAGCLEKAAPGQMHSPAEMISLKIPNKELYEIYKYSVDSWCSDILQPRMRGGIADAFWKGEETLLSELLSEFFLENVSFHDYNESFYHATLLGLLADSRHSIKSNRENGLGRSDLTVERKAARSVLIIEVKAAESEERLDAKADEALRQIEEKRYSASFKDYRNVLLWGVAFFKKSCMAKAAWERRDRQ